MSDLYRCVNPQCGHISDAETVTEVVMRERSEFWGHLSYVDGVDTRCPACGFDAIGVAACEHCCAEPADVDDKCRKCIVSDYLAGIEDFAADQQTYADKPWWPKVERWVLGEIKKRSDKRASDFRSVLIDIARASAIGIDS